MPIESFTGLPGAGKTTFMVEHLLKESEKGERPIFAAGIDGLKPGLATTLDDPRRWNAVKEGERCTCHDTENSAACEAHIVPNGSLIYVDEAWKWFGHLHDASRQANPAHVLQLAEHRHRGIDFVWTFQQPNQIYPFARGLMAVHHHIVRKFGTRLVDVFTWQELNEDVKSVAKRENAQRQTRAQPANAWAFFKSAEIHTVKSNVPWKVWLIPASVIAFIVLAWYAYSQLRPDAFAANLTGKRPDAAAAASGATVNGKAEDARAKPLYANATEYARAHLPRQATMPWSAPVYDGRGTTVDPQLFCMSSREGQGVDGEWLDFSCTCLTEQGTAYYISQAECRTLARKGPAYNPYREQRQQREPMVQTAVAEPVRERVAPGVVVAGDAADVGSGGEADGPRTAP